jgi:hypothetical protein
MEWRRSMEAAWDLSELLCKGPNAFAKSPVTLCAGGIIRNVGIDDL